MGRWHERLLCGMTVLARLLMWFPLWQLCGVFPWYMGALAAVCTIYDLIRCAISDEGIRFGTTPFVAFLTCEAFVLLTLHFAAPQSRFFDWGLAVASVECIAFFVLRNQRMLQRYVNRRSAEQLPIPREIARGNWYLLLELILFVSILLLFRRPLISLLHDAGEGLLWLTAGCLRLFSRLIATMGGDAPDGSTGAAEPEAEFIPETGEASPLWMLVWVVLVPLLAYLFYVFLREIWLDWYVAFVDWRIALRQRLHRARYGTVSPTEFEYVDEETDCRPIRMQTERKQRKAWRRAYRIWCASAESDEKFYRGYRLLTTAPAWKAKRPTAADTIAEIDRQWDMALAEQLGSDLHAVTAAYHVDRFGGGILQPDALAALATALDAIAKHS